MHFERTVDAVKAIKKANRMSINGRELHVEHFVSKGERKERNTTKNPQHFPHLNQTQENRTNLYVNGLDTTITNVILEDLFLRFGEITSAKIERDQYNKSRKFGFVCFRNPNAAAKAIEEMNGALIGDKCIYVGYAQKKSERKEFLSQQFNTNRQSPAKYTPNPEITHRKPYLADSQPKYCLPKRHSFCSSTNDNLTNNQGPIKTRSATNTTSIRSSADVRTAKTPLTRNTEATIQLDVGTDTDTRIGKVPRPISLISNELPLRQRNIMRSSSSERLSNYLSSVKIRSVPSSPTREFSQNFTFDQQTKDLHPLTPNSSFQASNVEVRARNKFERKTQPRELVSPQKSECVEDIQDLISRFETKSKDPIFSTKLPSGGTCSRKPVPNHEDYGWRPKIVDEKKHEMRRLNSQELPRNSRIQLVKNTQENTLKHFNKDQERNKRQNRVENKHQTQMHPETMQIEYDVCMSRKFVEDKIYDTARREHPNEANLIVGLITEKCTKEQLQLIATSDVLMDHEVEKARSKIRRLETPMCQNYL